MMSRTLLAAFMSGLLLLSRTENGGSAFVPRPQIMHRRLFSAPPSCHSMVAGLGYDSNVQKAGWNLYATSTPEDTVGLEALSYDSEATDDESSDDFDEEENEELITEFKLWSKAVKKAIKVLKKKQASLQSEWTKAQNVESTSARAQLLVNNLYLFTSPSVTSVTVQDWENDGKDVELTLDSQYESASAEADALFEQVRKLKRGSQIVSKLLEEASDALELLTEIEMDLLACETAEGIHEGRFRLIQDRLERTRSTTKFEIPSFQEPTAQKKKTSNSVGPKKRATPDSNVRKLTSPGGCPVWVGRNRRGNEYLSFQVGRGQDVWMHARGCPGAHVIVFHRRGGPEPTDECLQFAANLAVFYSDSRNEKRAAVTLAEPKHLLKPRGAPLGAVKLRQELQTLMGRPDDVPNELKLARDESGLSDEYHLNDKAKHRRRTLEVAKQDKARRRAQLRQKHRAKRNKSKSLDDENEK